MSEEIKEAKIVRYIGKGRFINGIPMRDLTMEEWKNIPKKKQANLQKLGLYEVKYG